MRKIVSLLAATGFLAGMAQCSQAAVVTFAQFSEFPATVQSTQVFQYIKTNPATTSGFLTTNTPSVPNLVQFSFKDLAPAALQGAQITARVILSATANNALPPASGGNYTQLFSNITLSFLAASTTTINGVTVTAGSNLLTMTSELGTVPGNGDPLSGASPVIVNGQTVIGHSATLSSSHIANTSGVVFTSDYIPGLVNAFSTDYALSFSSILPGLQRQAGGLGNSDYVPFTAAATGTFNADFTSVPEPGTVALMVGMGVSGSAFLVRRRRKK